MSIGQNPYVRKAQSAEAKAADATDGSVRTRAYRDAAHQWERAATREGPGHKRDEYEGYAGTNRRKANGEEVDLDD